MIVRLGHFHGDGNAPVTGGMAAANGAGLGEKPGAPGRVCCAG